MTLVAIGLIKSLLQFNPPAFQFYLYQWQPINQQSNIVPVFILSLHSHLVGNLEQILTPILLIQEIEIQILPIIPYNMLFLTQSNRLVEYRTFT